MMSKMMSKKNQISYNLRGIKIDPAGGTPDAFAAYGTVPDTGSVISIAETFNAVKKATANGFKPN